MERRAAAGPPTLLVLIKYFSRWHVSHCANCDGCRKDKHLLHTEFHRAVKVQYLMGPVPSCGWGGARLFAGCDCLLLPPLFQLACQPSLPEGTWKVVRAKRGARRASMRCNHGTALTVSLAATTSVEALPPALTWPILLQTPT